MSNIYLKLTIEKNWVTQNFDFLGSKDLSPGQYLRSSTMRIYHWILKLVVNLTIRGPGAKLCVAFLSF